MAPSQAARKLLGAWYTPSELVAIVVDNVIAGFDRAPGAPVTVLDPACGDGRFLAAADARLRAAGHTVELTGCDVDRAALDAIADRSVRTIHADALSYDWGSSEFEIVLGNPPFLSQMAATTTRGGSSRHGGGPYADAAVEFLALAVRLASPAGGLVGMVLPQSVLATRDAGAVRAEVAAAADLTWSWWEPRQQHFDASVTVCALGFRRQAGGRAPRRRWTSVVTDALGIPDLDAAAIDASGTLADRAELNANFRDEYYALVPAVGDHASGPPLVTSGLIDPGVCLWGTRPVTFARRRLAAPRVDLDRLTGRFPRWAARKLVPKVLVANQTRVIEAVADPDGAWLPGVPVNTVTPPPGSDVERVWELAAVLTAPVASVIAWQRNAGTGLSGSSVRIGPALLGSIAWPAGDLGPACAALKAGDIAGCGAAVTRAYGIDGAGFDELVTWWTRQLPGGA
jgi:hypothetical protein